MTFEDAHAAFLEHHLARRTGERRGRLERGHGHAEKLFMQNVWWELQGGFDDLHPEFEVLDWRNRSYFADFAWLRSYIKLIIEIKGYASHVRDMDRQKYCNELNRETFLTAMGYTVVSFAYDDVEQRPETCIALLRMLLARYSPSSEPVSRAALAERETLRLSVQAAQPIRPVDVAKHLGIDHRTAVNILQRLCAKGLLTPVLRGNGVRVVQYELARNNVLDIFS